MSEMELKNEAGASQKGISAAEHCGGSRLSELLRKYCPGGVEYVRLGDICEIKGRIGFRGYTRDDQVKEGEGALSLSPSNIQGGRMDYTKGTYITWAKYEESPEIKTYNGDIILCKTASVGKVALVRNLPYKATINPQLVVLKSIRCNAAYLAYVLGTDVVQSQIVSMSGVGSVPNISQKSLSSLEIPVPPMPVQEEIVRILDRFTELQAELQAELQKRKLQYNYYLDNLLNFNRGGYQDKVKWMKMSEIGTFYSGLSGKSKEDFQNGNAKFITYVNVFNHPALITDVVDSVRIFDGEKQNTVQYGDLLFTGSSETPDECGMCSVLTHHIEEKLYLNSFCFGFRFNDLSGINPDFMKFLFRSSAIRKLICRTANGVTRYNVSKKEFAKIVIPIPTITVQNEIVAILDKFYALLGDLTAGLPAEIEKRRQQYEYYRDKLLTFKRI